MIERSASLTRSHPCILKLAVIVSLLGNASIGNGAETADADALTTKSGYVKFVQELYKRSNVDLSKMARENSSLAAIHAGWSLVHNATKTKNEKLFQPVITKFGSMIRELVPTVPDWFIDDLTRRTSFTNRMFFDLTTRAPPVVDGLNTFDTRAYDKSLNALLDIAKTTQLQLDREFSQAVVTQLDKQIVALAASSNSVFLYKYTDSACGKHIVAFDAEGVRWVQRTLHSTVSQSGDFPAAARAELVVHGKNIWLFAISYFELMIEGYDLETGRPVFKLNSVLFDQAIHQQ